MTRVQVPDVWSDYSLGQESCGVETLAQNRPAIRYYCWALYARVTMVRGDNSRLQIRAHALHAIEEGGNDLASRARSSGFACPRHLKPMRDVRGLRPRLGGRLLRLTSGRPLEQLKAGTPVFAAEGRIGLLVMPIEDATNE